MIVLTLFRGMFWVPAARTNSEGKARDYALTIAAARGERVRVVTIAEWSKECDEREKLWKQQNAKAAA